MKMARICIFFKLQMQRVSFLRLHTHLAYDHSLDIFTFWTLLEYLTTDAKNFFPEIAHASWPCLFFYIFTFWILLILLATDAKSFFSEISHVPWLHLFFWYYGLWKFEFCLYFLTTHAKNFSEISHALWLRPFFCFIYIVISNCIFQR